MILGRASSIRPRAIMLLALSRVTADDFDTLVPIQFTAFANNGAHYAQLGFKNAENIAHAKAVFLEAFASDPADVWVKVTDEDANGRIIAASNWKIYPTYVKSDVDTKAAAFEKMKGEDESRRCYVAWRTTAEGRRSSDPEGVLRNKVYED
jgi:hypothetical protein